MTTCRSCHAPIFWCRSARNDAAMPLDRDPVPDGNLVVEDGRAHVLTPIELAALPAETPRYKSHHATCPDAASFRRRKS